MTVFDHYARYYDLLYRDKDYAGEASYIAQLLGDRGVARGTILELGSGTGKHAIELAKLGYEVDGYDLSSEMVAAAERLREQAGAAVSFSQGDVRTVRTGRRYDAVISLFHVMSYQTSTDDLRAAFRTAAEHLRAGGVFVFDCWYGPGVLTDLPAVRVKRLEDESCTVTRIAEPVIRASENVVDVNYTVFVTNRGDGSQRVIEERHPMRYLFQPEIGDLLSQCGLRLVDGFAWMTREEPDLGTWQAVFRATPV